MPLQKSSAGCRVSNEGYNCLQQRHVLALARPLGRGRAGGSVWAVGARPDGRATERRRRLVRARVLRGRNLLLLPQLVLPRVHGELPRPAVAQRRVDGLGGARRLRRRGGSARASSAARDSSTCATCRSRLLGQHDSRACAPCRRRATATARHAACRRARAVWRQRARAAVRRRAHVRCRQARHPRQALGRSGSARRVEPVCALGAASRRGAARGRRPACRRRGARRSRSGVPCHWAASAW